MESSGIKLNVTVSKKFIFKFYCSNEFDSFLKYEFSKNLFNEENVHVYNPNQELYNNRDLNDFCARISMINEPDRFKSEYWNPSELDAFDEDFKIDNSDDHNIYLIETSNENLAKYLEAGIAHSNIIGSKNLLINLFFGNRFFNNPSFTISTKDESWTKLKNIKLPIRKLVFFEPYLISWSGDDVSNNIISIFDSLKQNFSKNPKVQIEIITIVKRNEDFKKIKNIEEKRLKIIDYLKICEIHFDNVATYIKKNLKARFDLKLIYLLQDEVGLECIGKPINSFLKINDHNRWFYSNYFWCKCGRSFDLRKKNISKYKDDPKVESFISPLNMKPVIENWKLDFYDLLWAFANDSDTEKFIHIIS